MYIGPNVPGFERSVSDGTLRLFLALWPTDATRQALVENALLWDWPPAARLTRPERLHITLHFIGNVAASRVDELRRGLAVPFVPFEMTFGRPEVWKGGIAVLCAEEIPDELRTLHERLARRLHALELPVEERPLRVHATLARQAQGARMAVPAMPQVAWPARDGYALVRSLPGGQGYETLQRFA